jgi:hypothetical protein
LFKLIIVVMKTLFSTLIIFAVPAALLSQPVYTSFETDYPGKKVPFRSLSFADALPLPGGADQIWDYSSADTTKGGTGSIEITGGSGGVDFLDANYVRLRNGQTEYYKVSESEVVYLGTSPLGVPARLSDTRTEFRTDLTFGNSFTDSYSGTVGQGTPLSITRSGTQTVEFDGYGKLVTPYGLHENVIRFHVVTEETLTVPFSGPVTTTTDRYSYYLPGYLIPLAEETTINGMGKTLTLFNPSILTARVICICNAPDNFRLSPNPASDVVHINVTAADVIDIFVYNNVGVLVKEFSLNGNNGSLNIQDLENGIYNFTIKTTQGTENKKVIKI